MTRMRWNCQVRGCRLENRWDPASLDGTLPRRASFGDLDCWAEINGRFLFIEHKGENAIPENGQRMALNRLARLPGCTVWLIRDKDGKFELRDMRVPAKGTVLLTLEELRRKVIIWAQVADTLISSARTSVSS